jgi:hypothetical protein
MTIARVTFRLTRLAPSLDTKSNEGIVISVNFITCTNIILMENCSEGLCMKGYISCILTMAVKEIKNHIFPTTRLFGPQQSNPKFVVSK